MKYIYILLFSIIFQACSGDEKFINNFPDTNKALLVYNKNGASTIKVIDLLGKNVLNENILLDFPKSAISDTIEKIRQYRYDLFLFIPKAMKIVVVDFNKFEYKTTIDFSNLNLIPTDIAFANATDAYVTHENADFVSLVDLTNYKIAKHIKVGQSPRAIAAAGNQIYVANYASGTVSVVDSRTNRQEAIINVPPFPIFAEVRPDGKEIAIISRGQGKDFTDVVKTPAIATFINVSSRQKTAEIPIGTSTIKAEQVDPIASCMSSSYNLFVSSGTNLFRINARTHSAAINVGKYAYTKLIFNNYKNEIIAILEDGAKSKIRICDPSSGATKYDVPIENGIRWVQPIY